MKTHYLVSRDKRNMFYLSIFVKISFAVMMMYKKRTYHYINYLS